MLRRLMKRVRPARPRPVGPSTWSSTWATAHCSTSASAATHAVARSGADGDCSQGQVRAFRIEMDRVHFFDIDKGLSLAPA